MVVHPDGTVGILGAAMGDLMLGVDATAERTETVLELAPGTTILLYTDGLIERRNSTLDEGITRLVAQLCAHARLPLDELCDALIEEMLQGTPPDDVALVALRLAG
jgi:serine phosphatase RsbU (regulator of sigma subunit)